MPHACEVPISPQPPADDLIDVPRRIVVTGAVPGGLVQIGPNAVGARNYSQCDSMLIGDQAAANTYPYIRSQQPQAAVEHEASTCRISEDQLFYLQSRGIGLEEAVSMMVSGFCRDVFNQLPMEFAAEADKLLALKLEGSVG